MIYVLILFTLAGHAMDMHEFGSQQACQNALAQAKKVDMPGFIGSENGVSGVCVSKA